MGSPASGVPALLGQAVPDELQAPGDYLLLLSLRVSEEAALFGALMPAVRTHLALFDFDVGDAGEPAALTALVEAATLSSE
eukprot:9093591-Heterocapsa_arctica.AAC.1